MHWDGFSWCSFSIEIWLLHTPYFCPVTSFVNIDSNNAIYPYYRTLLALLLSLSLYWPTYFLLEKYKHLVY